jgi:hypothetical protein
MNGVRNFVLSVGVVAVLMLGMVVPAQAAVDASVTAGFTTLAADAATLGGLAALGATAITLLLVGIALGVRFLRRGAK